MLPRHRGVGHRRCRQRAVAVQRRGALGTLDRRQADVGVHLLSNEASRRSGVEPRLRRGLRCGRAGDLVPPPAVLHLQLAHLLRRELDRGRLAAEELFPAGRLCKIDLITSGKPPRETEREGESEECCALISRKQRDFRRSLSSSSGIQAK